MKQKVLASVVLGGLAACAVGTAAWLPLPLPLRATAEQHVASNVLFENNFDALTDGETVGVDFTAENGKITPSAQFSKYDLSGKFTYDWKVSVDVTFPEVAEGSGFFGLNVNGMAEQTLEFTVEKAAYNAGYMFVKYGGNVIKHTGDLGTNPELAPDTEYTYEVAKYKNTLTMSIDGVAYLSFERDDIEKTSAAAMDVYSFNLTGMTLDNLKVERTLRETGIKTSDSIYTENFDAYEEGATVGTDDKFTVTADGAIISGEGISSFNAGEQAFTDDWLITADVTFPADKYVFFGINVMGLQEEQNFEFSFEKKFAEGFSIIKRDQELLYNSYVNNGSHPALVDNMAHKIAVHKSRKTLTTYVDGKAVAFVTEDRLTGNGTQFDFFTTDSGVKIDNIVLYEAVSPYLVNGVTLTADRQEISTIQSAEISAAINPEDAIAETVVWKVNGEVAEGQSGLKYVFSSESAGEFGVTCTVNGTESAPINITVNKPAVETVEVSASSDSIETGGSAALTATVSPVQAEIVSYEWYVNGELIEGADKAEYVFTATTAGEYVFTCKVNGSVVSVGKTITVAAKPVTAASVTASSDAIKTGESSTLSVNITPSDAVVVSYQWYVNDEIIEGATEAEYEFAAEEAGVYSFKCIVNGEVESGAAEITVTATVADVEVESAVISATAERIETGESVTLSVKSSPAEAAVNSYQWFVNGEAIDGANKNSYVFSAETAGEYAFKCVVNGTVESDTKTLTVSVKITGVTLTVEKQTVEQSESTTITAVIAPDGAAADSYVWYVNNVVAEGETSNVYVFSSAQAGTYVVKCVVNGKVDSATATVTVREKVATVTISADDESYEIGGSATITAVTLPAAAEARSFAWYVNGDLVEGADESVYVFTAEEAGEYEIRCVVNGVVESEVITITVTEIAVTEVNVTVSEVAVNVGGRVIFSASTAPDAAAVNGYEWYVDGVKVENADGAEFEYTAAVAGVRYIKCVVNASVESNAVAVKVKGEVDVAKGETLYTENFDGLEAGASFGENLTVTSDGKVVAGDGFAQFEAGNLDFSNDWILSADVNFPANKDGFFGINVNGLQADTTYEFTVQKTPAGGFAFIKRNPGDTVLYHSNDNGTNPVLINDLSYTVSVLKIGKTFTIFVDGVAAATFNIAEVTGAGSWFNFYTFNLGGVKIDNLTVTEVRASSDIDSVSLTSNKLSISTMQTAELAATVLPATARIETVVWKVDGEVVDGQTGTTFTFSSQTVGEHAITCTVNGVESNELTITVTEASDEEKDSLYYESFETGSKWGSFDVREGKAHTVAGVNYHRYDFSYAFVRDFEVSFTVKFNGEITKDAYIGLNIAGLTDSANEVEFNLHRVPSLSAYDGETEAAPADNMIVKVNGVEKYFSNDAEKGGRLESLTLETGREYTYRLVRYNDQFEMYIDGQLAIKHYLKDAASDPNVPAGMFLYTFNEDCVSISIDDMKVKPAEEITDRVEPPVIEVESAYVTASSITIKKGESSTLTVQSSPFDATVNSYVWYMNGEIIAGADKKNYVFTATEAGEYVFKCVVNGTVTSESKTVTVTDDKPDVTPPEKEEKKDNKGLVIGLSVGGGVLALAAAGAAAGIIISKKRKK